MKIVYALLVILACCCMTACQSENASEKSSAAVPPPGVVAPVAVPVAPAQRGFGPAPLRPHFSQRYSNHNVKLQTQTPYPPQTTPAYQRDTVTLTDAAMNGTAGVHNIVIPTAPAPAQPAPAQPIIVEPYTGW